MNFATLLVLATLAVLASAAHAETPQGVSLRSASYAGTWCAYNSRAVSINDAADTLTIGIFYAPAEAGPGVPLAMNRRTCQTSIDLQVPRGWSYSLVGLSFSRYFAALDAGASAAFTVVQYYQGSSASRRFNAALAGPVFDRTEIVATPSGEAVWSPCGLSRALNLNESVRLATSRPGTRAILGADDVEDHPGYAFHIYKLAWKRCP